MKNRCYDELLPAWLYTDKSEAVISWTFLFPFFQSRTTLVISAPHSLRGARPWSDEVSNSVLPKIILKVRCVPTFGEIVWLRQLFLVRRPSALVQSGKCLNQNENDFNESSNWTPGVAARHCSEWVPRLRRKTTFPWFCVCPSDL